MLVTVGSAGAIDALVITRKELSMLYRCLQIVLCSIALQSFAHAQHAQFVLLGDPSADVDRSLEHRFVHPVTVPYFHEDSFITSDVRAWYAYHNFPKNSPIAGGDASVYAVQLRLAITNQIQLVAYKDGYTEFDSGLVDDGGWNDVAAGIKWNFLQDWHNQFHMAAGIGYEFSVGDDQVLQDNEELRLWLSINKGFDRLHLGGTINFFFAPDKSDGLGNSDHLIWNLHLDYYVCEWFSPVLELSGFHVMDEGTEVLPFSGVDVTNLGGGADVVTIGLGAEFRPASNIAIRAAYEMPLTRKEDLYGYRWTFSAIFSF